MLDKREIYLAIAAGVCTLIGCAGYGVMLFLSLFITRNNVDAWARGMWAFLFIMGCAIGLWIGFLTVYILTRLREQKQRQRSRPVRRVSSDTRVIWIPDEYKNGN